MFTRCAPMASMSDPTKDEAVAYALRTLRAYRDVDDETLRSVAEIEFDLMEGEHGGIGTHAMWVKCTARMFAEQVKAHLRRR